MLLLAAVDGLHYLFMIPLSLLSVFLILVILVQRGRGGGLTGALGGMGGQSAFGTKAGDLFTRITIGVAALWVVTSMLSLRVLNQRANTGGLSTTRTSAPVLPGPVGKDGTGIPAKKPADEKATDDGKTPPQSPPPATPPAGDATPPAESAKQSESKSSDTAKP